MRVNVAGCGAAQARIAAPQSTSRGAQRKARRDVQSLLADEGPAGDPRPRRRDARPHRQPAARCPASFPTTPRRSCATRRTAARTGAGALGHAVAGVRAEGPQFRPRRHQRAQRRLAALAALARRREPLRRAVHLVLGERGSARRLAAAGLVRARRKPAAGVLRRHLDALDLGAEGQGGRDDQRPLRLPHDRAERRRRADPSQGDAGDPDHAGRDRPLADRAGEGSAGAAAAAAGRRAAHRRARTERGSAAPSI